MALCQLSPEFGVRSDVALPVPTERQTVTQFVKHWLENVARPRLRPRSFLTYEQTVRLHILPGIGRHPLQKLTPQHVQQWINDLQTAGASARGCRYARAILRTALSDALRWGLVSRNVAKLVDTPRVPKHEIQFFTPEQARGFLDAIAGHRLEALFSIAIALGLRKGEATGLRWQDVDLESGVLHVRNALQRLGGDPAARRPLLAERTRLKRELKGAKGDQAKRKVIQADLVTVQKRLKPVQATLVLVEPKTVRSRRAIRLPALVVKALKGHRVRQLQERLAAGGDWRELDFVFPTSLGTPMDPRNVNRVFTAVLAAANLPAVRVHDLRHTAASLLLAQGVAPRTIMEILGHSQISLTMDTYAHIMPTLQQDAAQQMNAILSR
jgi:integrase